jgi:hypothetical protein
MSVQELSLEIKLSEGEVGDPFNWFNPVMKFVSDLQQVGGLVCPGTPLSSNNKTDNHDITEIMLKVVSVVFSGYSCFLHQ